MGFSIKHRVIFIVVGIFAIASFTLPAFAATASSSIKDSGTMEGKVLDIFKRSGYEYEFGTLKIETIVQYRHYQNADFEPLKVGDEVTAYFNWGTAPRKVRTPSAGGGESYMELPGVGVGDKIQVFVFGCPDGASCGTGWRFYRYTILERAPSPPSPPPTPPSLPTPPPASPPPEPVYIPPPDLPREAISPAPFPSPEAVPPPAGAETSLKFWVLLLVTLFLGLGIFFVIRSIKR